MVPLVFRISIFNFFYFDFNLPSINRTKYTSYSFLDNVIEHFMHHACVIGPYASFVHIVVAHYALLLSLLSSGPIINLNIFPLFLTL